MSAASSANLFPAIWNSTTIHKTGEEVDCSYAIDSQDMSFRFNDDTFTIKFTVNGKECISKTSILGGSSFHVTANNEDFLSSCGVIDLFNDNYSVECRLPSIPIRHAKESNIDSYLFSILNKTSTADSHTNIANLSLLNAFTANTAYTAINATETFTVLLQGHDMHCMNITVVLEHEHYDAFGREGGLPTPPQHYFPVLKDHVVCFLVKKSRMRSRASFRSLTDSNKNDSSQTSSQMLLFDGSNTRGVWSRDTSNYDGQPYDNNIYKYKWNTGDQTSRNLTEKELTPFFITHNKGNDSVMSLSHEKYKECQARQTNIMVGESHQRFTWSYLAYHYHEGQKIYLETLERKHGDVVFYKFALTQKFMIRNAVLYLDELICPMKGNVTAEKIAIAIQMGSWDLTASPLRNVLEHSEHGMIGVLEAIRRMQLRGCSDMVKIVYIQPMPYPFCNINDGHCRYLQGWHNTYATGALSEYVRAKLLDPKYYYGDISIVDSVSIMKANINQYECQNHFLCRHGDKQNYRVASTPAGEALASEIITALCEE